MNFVTVNLAKGLDDTKPEAEAWVRRKPRRIIHNQTLIQLFAILAIVAPLPATGALMYLVFSVAPSIAVPLILALWFFAVIFEISVWILKRRSKVRRLDEF